MESTLYLFLPVGVFLTCDYGLDFLHQFYVRIQSINQSINQILPRFRWPLSVNERNSNRPKKEFYASKLYEHHLQGGKMSEAVVYYNMHSNIIGVQ